MPGRYIDVQINTSQYSDEQLDSMSICSFGIMGTKYVLKEGATMPTSIEMTDYESKIVTIPYVESKFEIGNELNIKLRNAYEPTLSWVNLDYGTEQI